MAGTSVTNAALDIGGKIGRNFSVVSMVPSLFLVLWTYALIESGAWSGPPDLADLRRNVAAWGLAEVAWLLVAALMLGLLLHPLQFATIQLLEGYWGGSRLALAAASLRVMHYRRKWQNLGDRLSDHICALEKAFAKKGLQDERDLEARADYLDSEDADDLVSHVVARDVLRPLQARFPDARRIMPTRLGNTLRRFEDSAGSQYGIEAITTATHFGLIVPDRHLDYLDDARQQLDATARLCSMSAIATVLAVSALFTDGLWLLVALVPYLFTYVAYRATIGAADEYTSIASTLIDLNRFALYSQLGVAKPASAAAERETNALLMPLLRHEHTDPPYASDEGTGQPAGTGLLRRLLRRRTPK
jgi:hypothetical protein